MTTSNILSQLGSPGVSTGFKNRIINGAMVIDQRNAGAPVTVTGAGQYPVDRFLCGKDTSGATVTAQQSSTAPVGFVNSLIWTTSIGSSATGSQENIISQRIEGYNVADLNWGSANAKTVTLSFLVRSSLTGTFGGSLRNSGGSRSYPFTYTISVANTWEQKSVTIAGDTTGTWLTTNGQGINVTFDMGSGATVQGTAGAWAGANYLGATGTVSVVGTTGATFYITGVQLEVGTTATNFDYRSIGTELALCQRYYWGLTTGVYKAVGSGVIKPAGNVARLYVKFPQTMRAVPTLSYTGAMYITTGSTDITTLSLSAQYTCFDTAILDMNMSSGVTAGGGAMGYMLNGSADTFQGNAEL